jgi:hypothetical protein
MRIRVPGWKNSDPGWKKFGSGIRVKHSGCATQEIATELYKFSDGRDVEDKGWWKGELEGRVGVFPDNFVKLLQPELVEPEVN